MKDNTTPNYVVLTPAGKLVEAKGGYVPLEQFRAFLEEALKKARQ